LYPRFKTRSNGTRKVRPQSLILPRGSLLAVTPEVHCLDVLRMVISSRPSHSSRVNVVGHDVAIVRERHLADGALPVLFDDFAVEQLPHLCLGAEFAVSPGVMRVFDTLHPQASESASLLDQLTAAARNGSVDGAEFLATEFHGLLRSLVENGLEPISLGRLWCRLGLRLNEDSDRRTRPQQEPIHRSPESSARVSLW
jgi:hypothetical protein